MPGSLALNELWAGLIRSMYEAVERRMKKGHHPTQYTGGQDGGTKLTED